MLNVQKWQKNVFFSYESPFNLICFYGHVESIYEKPCRMFFYEEA